MATYLTCCNICLENYNDEGKKPIYLPCSHTGCSLCLSTLEYNNNRKCPLCHQSWAHTRVDKLIVARQLIPKAKGTVADTITCVCKQHNNKATIYWCTTCQAPECNLCRKEHANNIGCDTILIKDALEAVKSSCHQIVAKIGDKISRQQIQADLGPVMHKIDTIGSTDEAIQLHCNLKENLDARCQDVSIEELHAAIQNITRSITGTSLQNTQNGDNFRNIEHPCLRPVASHISDRPPTPSLPAPSARSVPPVRSVLPASPGRGSAPPLPSAPFSPPPPVTTVSAVSQSMRDGGYWEVINAASAAAAVQAFTVGKRPEKLTLMSGEHTPLADAEVAAVAAAAKNCEVVVRFLDSLNGIRKGFDNNRLECIYSNSTIRITGFSGHLDAEGIAKLPQTVEVLSLSISTSEEAVLVSNLVVWEDLRNLSVAVSSTVALRHLLPLPNVDHMCCYFYGLTDDEVERIRPAIDALIGGHRLTLLSFPSCHLTPRAAHRLAEALHGLHILVLAIFTRRDASERASVEETLRRATQCRHIFCKPEEKYYT